MPIHNSKDLIAFVNLLEEKIGEMNQSLSDWEREKYKILNLSSKFDTTSNNALTALIRADEALTEISTACFESTAGRGKRLEDTLRQLKDEIYKIASNTGNNAGNSGGGGGELTKGVFFEELNNAVASVDVNIEEGLKLDYRLRQLQEMALANVERINKELFVPHKYNVDIEAETFTVIQPNGVKFIDGDVSVLTSGGMPARDEYNRFVTGTITEKGVVSLSTLAHTDWVLYFPVKMQFKDIPEDFLYIFLQQMVQKNSKITQILFDLEDSVKSVQEDMQSMKGANWTADFSIMRNHQDVVKEGITPKGLQVQVKDGMANVTFSYADHPYLSHFVVEKWDESKKAYVPFDGKQGIVSK
ncbi:hypothetical protein [Bacillus tropicus]|uniref:hypothetical protein n=1 Tax=Bacillus tropicus TaxID=2026188 RepID=UPI0021D20073|nr:hypothetical protein [Bacillus tropicus]MCU5224155.1 hypothetical protein [Bacillus tropicus]